LHSEVKVDLTGTLVTITQWHKCDPTVELDCATGIERQSKSGTVTGILFKLASASLPIRINYQCAASNPCWRGSPDIDCEGAIVIDLAARTISVNGKIDAFPAFEMYATTNDGAGREIFKAMPPPGNTPMNLPGRANRPVSGRIIF
jgi:hypothetical protein